MDSGFGVAIYDCRCLGERSLKRVMLSTLLLRLCDHARYARRSSGVVFKCLLRASVGLFRLFLPSASKRSNWLSAGFSVQKPVKLASFSHFDSRNGSCAAFKRPICPSESALRECKNRLSALTNPRKRLILPFRCVGQEWPRMPSKRDVSPFMLGGGRYPDRKVEGTWTVERRGWQPVYRCSTASDWKTKSSTCSSRTCQAPVGFRP
jgi:hypothetical protein